MEHDGPIIRNMERTGYPDGKEPEYPHCPICGEVAYDVYISGINGRAVGCPSCIDEMSAWDLEECLEVC